MKNSLFLIIGLITVIVFSIPQAFADHVPPSVNIDHDTTVVWAENANGAIVNYVVWGGDGHGNDILIPTCDIQSGTLFPTGETRVTCSVTTSGGSSSADFAINVLTNEIPTAVDDFFELVAQEKSYGGVLTAQFVNFRNKHLIKIFLNKLEILSEIDDGPAESKLRAYVDQVKVKYFSKIREILEENHRKFKERAIGPHAPISISYDEKRYIRLTHCWNCKNDIDSLNFYTCNECTGIICFCGACFCSHTGY